MFESKLHPQPTIGAPPLSPVSETEREVGESTPTPSDASLKHSDRKLSIRVPMDYIPPTPPPSASLPALPSLSRRQSMPAAPLQQTSKNRSSLTPAGPPAAWNNVVHALSAVQSPISHPPSTKPEPAGTTESEKAAPNVILVSATDSAIHLPTAATQLYDKEARSAAELTPPSPPSVTQTHGTAHTSWKTTSTTSQQHLQAPPASKLQKSPSIMNSPSHVSLIEFDSSSDEDEHDKAGTPQNLLHPFPEERVEQRLSQAHSDESDLSKWAPEPASISAAQPVYFPSHSASYVHSLPRAPLSTRSRSSISHSTRSAEKTPSIGRRTAPLSSARRQPLMGLSSLPGEAFQQDVDFTMRALMSPEMFESMLRDPLSRQRFREFVAVDGDVAQLDMWTDTNFLAQSIEQAQINGAAFRDLYVSNSGDSHVALPTEDRRELLTVLQRVLAVDSSFGTTQSHLLESMYNNQFQRFVKHKIIQETHVTLGKVNLSSADSEGLGDTFVLTNPRLPDHPIVLVSDGFVDVTGYPKAQIIGRNCRFLQGPGTPPASVQRIRDGLNSGKGCTELLLNYRRNGDPFYCLLCIIPIRDASGAIVYFVGGQTNVTGLLANERGLGFLGTRSDASQPMMQMSPALAQFRERAGVAMPLISDPHVRGAAGAQSGSRAGVGSAGTTIGNSGGRFFRGLFGRTTSTGSGLRPDGKQVIAGAEAMVNEAGARGLQDQYALFQNTYNKLLIFKQKKREITFVTPQMLTYLGLPTRTQKELLGSPLIRNDIAALLTAGEDKNETRRLRAEVKEAIRRGVPCSVQCGVKIPGKSVLGRTDYTKHKFGMMHMTPIKDSDGVSVAFVAVFG